MLQLRSCIKSLPKGRSLSTSPKDALASIVPKKLHKNREKGRHDSRPKRRHLEVARTRPFVPYLFDTVVQLSDGSTYHRRSPFPRLDWVMLKDSRNHPYWNPTLLDLSAQQQDVHGRLAKFRDRFGFTASTEEEQEPSEEIPKAAEKATKANKEVPGRTIDDDYFDLMIGDSDKKNDK